MGRDANTSTVCSSAQGMDTGEIVRLRLQQAEQHLAGLGGVILSIC